ncbi:DMT family transporter [Candidatus Dependentiae bacterium]
MIEILGLHALWGASIPMSKQLLSYTSPTVLTAIRMLASGVLLLGINYFRKATSLNLNPRFWLYNGQIIVAIFLKYQLRNWSLAYMPASKMSFFLNITPFVVALFAYVAFKDKLTNKQWLGLVIGFLGMVPLIITTSSGEQNLGEFLYLSWPELAIFGAACVEAYSMIMTRILIREHKQSVVLSNGIRMLGAGFLALTVIGTTGIPFEVHDVGQFAFWMGSLVLLSNVICHNFRLHLYKYYSVTFLAFTDFISPLFTAFYSWMFLNEKIGWHYALSAVIVVCGLYLFYQDELKSVYVRPEPAV